MATKKRKTASTATAKSTMAKAVAKTEKPKGRVRKKRRAAAAVNGPALARRKATPIDVAGTDADTSLEMKGERLVVKLSKESHPEVFEIDRLIKAVRKVRESNKSKRKLRDLCEFLVETEKSLQILLSNHLEEALRKYLG